MSRQINLYDPALRSRRELLTAGHLALTALVLLVAMGTWGGLARARLGDLEAETGALAPRIKTLQDDMIVVGQQVERMKPDPRLDADLAAARDTLALREEVATVLKKGVGTEAVNFAEYLRGFARQSVSGLWLTGVAVAEGGTALEIRGRMTDPALLPEYIRRLNGEKAFQGRAFATLKVSAGLAAADKAALAPSAGASRAPYHEFALAPVMAPGRAVDATGTLPPMEGRR